MRPQLGLFLLGISLCVSTVDVLGADVDLSKLEASGFASIGDKLLKASQLPDLKEVSNPESYKPSELDPDSGNSRISTMAYHSNVWDYCESWLGPMSCDRWRDPYISGHGLVGDDYSPIEHVVGEEYKKLRDVDEGAKYAIWEIERLGGVQAQSNRDADGKLDREDIVDMRVVKPLQDKLVDLGERSATHVLSSTYDSGSRPNSGVLPNIEATRLIASRFTKMFRNRLVSNLGHLRTDTAPIEFALNDEKPDCESYLKALPTEGDQLGMEDRLEVQARLDPQTMGEDLRRRFRLCTEMRRASVNMVNPEVDGDDVVPGDPQTERFDKWRTRLNIAVIDHAGIDPNMLPKPSNVHLTKRGLSTSVTEYEVGGKAVRLKQLMTNKQAIKSYNHNLKESATGWKEVAALSPSFIDKSKDVLKEQVLVGERGPSLVRLNGLTKEMRTTLRDTIAARKMPALAEDPLGSQTKEVLPEQSPAELTLSKR